MRRISLVDGRAIGHLGRKLWVLDRAERDMQLARSPAQQPLRDKWSVPGSISPAATAARSLQHPRPTVADIRDKPLRQRNRVRRSVRRAPGYGANIARHSLEPDVSQRAQDLFIWIETRLQPPKELDDQDVAEAQ